MLEPAQLNSERDYNFVKKMKKKKKKKKKKGSIFLNAYFKFGFCIMKITLKKARFSLTL